MTEPTESRLSYLRRKLGIFLLRPVLLAEHKVAAVKHRDASTELTRRYWAGRQTAVRRIIDGWATASEEN